MVITTSMLGGMVASCTPLISAWFRCIVGLLTQPVQQRSAATARAAKSREERDGVRGVATPSVYARRAQGAVRIGRRAPDDAVPRVERLDGPAVAGVDADVTGPPEDV